MWSLWVALLAANKVRHFAASPLRELFVGMWLPKYQVRALAEWMLLDGPHAARAREEADSEYRIAHFRCRELDGLVSEINAGWPLNSPVLRYAAPVWPGMAWAWLMQAKRAPGRVCTAIFRAPKIRRAQAEAVAEWRQRDTRPIWEVFDDGAGLESVDLS